MRSFIVALFILCLLLNLRLVLVGWDNPILGRHAFRQTQTALAVRSLLDGAPLTAYEVPVFGKPWAIPVEFPLYQVVVASVVRATGSSLEQTGRAVGIAAFYLTLVCVFLGLRILIADRLLRLLPLSFLLASPLYIFWSRAFLIESTALLLAVGWLLLSMHAIAGRRPVVIILALIIGALAAMTKITTLAVAAVPLFFYAAGSVLRAFRAGGRSHAAAAAMLAALLAGVPVGAGWLWTQHAAGVRSNNPIARHTLSDERVTRWMYGTAEQRMSSSTWSLMVSRSLPDVIGITTRWPAGVALAVLALFVVWSTPHRRAVLVCLAAFASGPLIFTNVFYVHDYYFFANGLYLVLACGLAAVAAMERLALRARGPWAATAVAAFIALMFAGYYQRHYLDQSVDRGMRPTVAAIRRLTAPRDVLVVFGEGGSPAIPYYSNRRALLDDLPLRPDDPHLLLAIRNLSDERIGGVLVSGAFRGDQSFLTPRLALFDCHAEPAYSDAFSDLYLARSSRHRE